MTHFDGVDAFLRGINGINERVDRETHRAVGEGLAAIQRQAQINSTARPGPKVGTGSHRRGIRTTPVRRVGSFVWGGEVGPTMKYSRRLQLGGGNWPAGLSFPYFDSAMTYASRVAIPIIFRRAWARATGGG